VPTATNPSSVVSDLFAQAREFWGEATPPVRAALLGGITFLILLALGLTFWAATPDFVPVFRGTPGEAQSLARELDKAAIAYRVSDDGGALSVRRADAGQARQVAGGVAGVIEGTRGLRGLESASPFLSQKQQDARIERAQEEAIELELGRYAGVQNVAVNLALPETSLRVSTSGAAETPKAAVTLSPVPGTRFDEAQVAAMAHVVASSVPGLSPQNVTIASTEGTTLWGGADGAGTNADRVLAGAGALQTRTRAEKEYVRGRQAELQASLDRVFGPRKAIVYVDASLDLDKQDSQAKRYTPAGEGETNLPAGVKSKSEQLTGAGRLRGGGMVGADANRPGAVTTYPAADAVRGGGSGTYKLLEETTNYQHNVELIHTVKAAGDPKRLNVAVWVDDTLPKAVQDTIRSWIEGSVINPANRETTRVTVLPAPFDRSLDAAAAATRAASDRQAWLAAYAPYIVVPASLLLMVLAAYLLTRRRRLPVPEFALAGAGAAVMSLPAGLPSGGDQAGALTGDSDTNSLSGSGIGGLLDYSGNPNNPDGSLLLDDGLMSVPPPRMRRIQEKVEPELEVVLDFIDQRPETAALLLRSWTAEEERIRA